jgi:AGZA family xanthine/uracil permease-like MFS transporter
MNFLDKYFGITESDSTWYKELTAGVATFFAMSYILFANPAILAEAGMDRAAQFTATTLACIFGCLVMGLYAKLPFAVAPGMGLNAFFAYTVCLALGHNWQFALTSVLAAGLIFVLLSIFNLRNLIVNLIPKSLQQAFCPAIGLFVAFIGLQQAGIIKLHEKTISSFGDISDPNVLLACFGILVMGILYIKNVYGGMLLGVLLLTFIGIPLGITKVDILFSAPPSISGTLLKFDFSQILTYDFICVTILCLSMNIFDATGTFLGLSNSVKKMLNSSGEMKNTKKAFIADSLSVVFGAMVGTSSSTAYVESSAGISIGGRTGFVSVVTALCFAIALFLFPLLSAVPQSAVAVMLIFAGSKMFMSLPLKNINIDDYSETIPAFITMVMIPFSYSIVEGISFGVLCYVLLNAATGNFKKVGIGTYFLAAFFILRYVLAAIEGL